MNKCGSLDLAKVDPTTERKLEYRIGKGQGDNRLLNICDSNEK